MRAWMTFLMVACVLLPGCGVLEARLFPVWPPNFIDEPPAELGPYTVEEYRVEVEDGADGSPFGITVFEPEDAEGPLPVFMWVMGSNVQAYYHQSLHETLASWGYLVLVPDTRELLFTDFQYHNRVVQLAEQTLDIFLAQDSKTEIDDSKIGAGGYSVGGPLAAFTAGPRRRDRRPGLLGALRRAVLARPGCQRLVRQRYRAVVLHPGRT